MTQRKRLATIEMISDDDCGMYRIGEIDDIPHWVVRYVERYGDYGYRQVLDYAAHMMALAREALIAHNNENEQCCSQETYDK